MTSLTRSAGRATWPATTCDKQPKPTCRVRSSAPVPTLRPDVPKEGFGWAVMQRMAAAERFAQARTSALFSALAAEAYINEYLAAVAPSKRKLKEADSASTVKKYTAIAAEFAGEPLFSDGDLVVKTLTKLFKLRHQLVHPKPGLGQGPVLDSDDSELEAMFRPLTWRSTS